MQLAVNPNRMELLRLRRRIGLAVRGHKLLRDKQDELMRRFMQIISDTRRLRKLIEGSLGEALSDFLSAEALMPPETAQESVFYNTKQFQVDISTKRVLNLTLPSFRIRQIPDPLVYGFAETPVILDRAVGKLFEIMPKLIELAELETTILALAEELQRTRRRVNALEYVFIPALVDTSRFITMKLEEFERSNIARLMRVKQILAK